MKTRILTLILLSLSIAVQPGSAQPSCSMPATRSWIHLTETMGFGIDTIWFGYDSAATFGIDTQLCEYEVMPTDAPLLFVDPHGGTVFGQGVFNDFRSSLGAIQIDTHQIQFGVSWPTVFTLHWSPLSIQQICDSAVLVDVFGLNRFRLDLGDSLYQVPDLLQSWYLIRYGTKSSTVDVREGQLQPHTFRLFQNYPNPFNPTTEIRYELAERGFVTLDVVDVMGRVVATLIRRIEPPGFKTTTFDANGLGGGLYFVRLNVDGSVATQKIVLLR